MGDSKSKHLPERPIECGECKRKAAVVYTEIVAGNVTKTCMCDECPVLGRKLRGTPDVAPLSISQASLPLQTTHVCCGSCGMRRDEVIMGAHIGCPLCYSIFGDEILDLLLSLKKIPYRPGGFGRGKYPGFGQVYTGDPVHKGRRPYSSQEELDLSSKLMSLQKTLHETLSREDYEQAAWIRDRIKEIMSRMRADTPSPADGEKENGKENNGRKKKASS